MESDNRKNARIYSLLATQVIQDPYGKGRKRYNAFKILCLVGRNSFSDIFSIISGPQNRNFKIDQNEPKINKKLNALYDKVKENLIGITEFAFTKGADGKQVFLFFKATGKLEKRWNEDMTRNGKNLKCKIEVVENDRRDLNGRTKGDSVKALVDIYPGELLFRQKPFSTCLAQAQYMGKCYNCMKTVYEPWPCEHCRYANFCSEECRKECWERYHKTECKYSCPAIGCLGLTTMLKGIHSDPSLFLTDELGISNFNKYTASRDSDVNNLIGTSENSFKSVLNLKGVRGKDQADYKKTVLFSVAYTLLLIQEKLILDTKHDFFAISKLFLDIHFKTKHNHLGTRKLVDLTKLNDQSEAFDYHGKTLDTGLIPAINHSCYNNCSVIYDDKFNYIVALRKIRKGDEITINFGETKTDCSDSGTDVRREILMERYGFECNCEGCDANWPESLETTFVGDDEKTKNFNRLFGLFKDAVFCKFEKGDFLSAFETAKKTLEFIENKGLRSKETLHFQERFINFTEMYFNASNSHANDYFSMT